MGQDGTTQSNRSDLADYESRLKVLAVSDPLFRIKYLGYCLAQVPTDRPGAKPEDFINFAKFKLCVAKNILFFDPVWDGYTDEEILVEYYAMLFNSDAKFLKEFETRIEAGAQGETGSDIDWMLQEAEKISGEKKVEDKPEVLDENETGFEDTPETLSRGED